MKKIAILAAATVLTACEKTIDFKGDGPAPKLIVGAVFSPADEDDEHDISLRESVFLFGGEKPSKVTDATFRLWRNGVEMQQETEDWGEGGIHRHFRFPIAAGDRLELSAETPKHGRVTASDVVPAAADFRDLKTEWYLDKADYRGEQEWHLRTLVTLADPAGEKNYYRVKISSLTRYTTSWVEWDGEVMVIEDSRSEDHYVDVSKEIVFANFGGDPAGGAESWTQFSDELIDGRQYTLDLSIQLDRDLSHWDYSSYTTEVIGQTVTVEVQTLSASLFKYLRSVETIGGEHNFSEPVRLFSNVQGGYGIFGLYNVASKTVELPLLEK